MRRVLNNKVLLFIVAILLVANVAMLVYIFRMREPVKTGSRTERQKSPITEFLQNEIGFSPDQMAAFDTIRQNHRQKLKPLFEDIKTAKVAFYKSLTNPGVNDPALDSAASVIGQKQKLLDMQTFKNFKELRTLCTPDQQPKYDSLIVKEISRMWFPSWRGNSHSRKTALNLNINKLH